MCTSPDGGFRCATSGAPETRAYGPKNISWGCTVNIQFSKIPFFIYTKSRYISRNHGTSSEKWKKKRGIWSIDMHSIYIHSFLCVISILGPNLNPLHTMACQPKGSLRCSSWYKCHCAAEFAGAFGWIVPNLLQLCVFRYPLGISGTCHAHKIERIPLCRRFSSHASLWFHKIFARATHVKSDTSESWARRFHRSIPRCFWLHFAVSIPH